MSTSTAALHRNPMPPDAATSAWKTELNAKLEAHRQRRGLGSEAAPSPHPSDRGASETGEDRRTPRVAASRVAARVAERYAKAPSYSEVLAANAAAAAAAVEMALAAAAAAQAHQAAHELFSDLAERELERAGEGRVCEAAEHRDSRVESAAAALDAAARPTGSERPATVEHPTPLPSRTAPPGPAATATNSSFWIPDGHLGGEFGSLGRFDGSPAGGTGSPGWLDAFAEAEVPPATSLPAKLIEFPRELVAARKSRPRIAEGPLADTPLFDELPADPSPLRIFEVQGSGRPDAESHPGEAAQSMVCYQAERPGGRGDRSGGRLEETGAGAPQWQSIRLGEHPSAERSTPPDESAVHRGRHAEASPALPLHVAALADRGMAALVDFAVVTAAFLLFVLVFASCTTHPPLDKAALAGAGGIFASLLVFYQWLFLSYGGETLGMRYAQIALCTFDDENPTRTMLRRRLWASLLAALPVGLGLVWAVFDDDALGWHDRMSRTYQRSYR